MLKNKKGWIRIAEASIAVMILASVIIVLLARQVEKKGFGEDMYKLQQLILEEAAKNESVRDSVLNSRNLYLIDNFIAERMPIGIEFNVSICNPSGICNVETTAGNSEIYANDVLISSLLEQYQPKKLKMISWLGEGKAIKREYGGAGDTIIIYYIDEGAGNIVRDSSGNSFNGEVIGTYNWVAGKSGYALKFDGTNYINMSLPEIREKITIEAWINPTSLTNGDVIIMKPFISDASPMRVYGLSIGTSGSKRLRFSIAINNNSYYTETDNNGLKTGQWQHVAGVYDGTRIKVYVNGAEKKSRTISGKIDTNSMPVWIAKGRVSSMTNSFKGSVDTVMIYKKALTSTEILQHWKSG